MKEKECNFCSKYEWSEESAVIEGKYAHIVSAGGSSRFDVSKQFNYCPVCGKRNPNKKTHEVALTYYLFLFSDESVYEMTNAVSIKDAVWEMAKYYGDASDMLRKCLKGYESDDIDGIIELYNRFSSYKYVDAIYCIGEKIFDRR